MQNLWYNDVVNIGDSGDVKGEQPSGKNILEPADSGDVWWCPAPIESIVMMSV